MTAASPPEGSRTVIRRTILLSLPLVAALGAARLEAQAASGPGLLVSGAWLEERLGDPRILVLQIDGRRDGWDAGHIPGSRFIAQSAITLDSGPGYELPSPDSVDRVLEAAGVGDDVHVVITTGSPLAATRLWLTLDYLGHGGHASILDGGMVRWKAEGRPLDTAASPATRGSLTPRPRPDMVVDADWIARRLDDPGVALIDARPDDEYTGTDGGMGGAVHPGHIPGAVQLYWERLIVSRQADPSFLPLDQLRASFEAAGARADRTVVTYCMIGARASLTYFVGRLLGYEMRFYDGSWHDWGARDLPHVAGRNPR
jgi:thiosulfate/3-mercaptopyruvate sulfurtransferase